jgi:hypothetical protein
MRGLEGTKARIKGAMLFPYNWNPMKYTRKSLPRNAIAAKLASLTIDDFTVPLPNNLPG